LNIFVLKGALKENMGVSMSVITTQAKPEAKRALPQPTPETQAYWDGAKLGELRVQRCDECAQIYFPPRPFCPQCACRSVSWIKASGRASLHSYVISHRPAPGFTPPYSIAVVELAEGPRMMTNIVDCPQTPEALQLDMQLEVTFVSVSDAISLPQFKPVRR
jgi:uncharacterized OB-fold protein